MNTDQIIINTNTFEFMLKLIFVNCKETDIDKLTKMIDEETSVPNKLIDERSI